MTLNKYSYLLLSVLVLGVYLISLAENKIDSLKIKLKSMYLSKIERANLNLEISKNSLPTDGIYFADNSLSLFKELKDSISICLALEEVSAHQWKMGNTVLAIEALLEALQINEELGKQKNINQICEINKIRSILYEEKGKYNLALQYRKQYEIYHDSLVNIDNAHRFEQLQTQYQLKNKQADIDILTQNNRTKITAVYLLSVSSFVLVILLLILLHIWYSKRKAYNILKEQNIIIEKREQEKSLLLRELNHRVKNNLQMVSSLLSLQAYELKDHPAAEALRISKYRVEALMLIHQKLYNNNLHSEISLKEYIEELASGLIFNFGKKIELKIDIDQIVIPFEQAIPIGLIINELVTNALKYVYIHTEEPRIELSLINLDNEVQLIVADNGPGLKELDCNKVQSLGIKLVRSLIEQLNGEFKQENINGCIWKINFKLDQAKI